MFFYNEQDSGGEVSQVLPSPSDPYFYDVSLLLPMDSDLNDVGPNSYISTVNGGAGISSAEVKFGTASGEFNGGNYTTFPTAPGLTIGTQDFTIEMWINRNGTSGDRFYPFQLGGQQTGALMFGVQYGKVELAIYPNGYTSPTVDTTPGQWHHIAATRESGTVRVFVDGNLVQTATDNTNIIAADVHVGSGPVWGQHFDGVGGYIDDLRLTVGVARYTANFTPPTEAHPTTGPGIVTDSLTLNLDIGDDTSYAGTGTTVNNIAGSDTATLAGNIAFSPNNEGYLDFDGADDTMGVANGSSVDITDAITIEAWINPDAVNGWTALVYKNNINQSEGYHMGFDPGGNLAGGVRNSGVWYTTQPGAATSVAVGQWQHFVMSMDTATNVQKFYKNGVLVHTNSNFTRNLFSNTNPLSISGQPITGVEKYNGKLAKTALYSRALTDEEVTQNFNALKSRFGL